MSEGDRKAFLLRIPSDLWAELEKWAADELRSVNGQIEYILRQAVTRRGRAAEQEKALVPPPSEPRTRRR
jgi:hypothetical protein